MSDDDEYMKCLNCGQRIEWVNFTLNPRWLHWPTPWGNYLTREKYLDCHMGFVATPIDVN